MIRKLLEEHGEDAVVDAVADLLPETRCEEFDPMAGRGRGYTPFEYIDFSDTRIEHDVTVQVRLNKTNTPPTTHPHSHSAHPCCAAVGHDVVVHAVIMHVRLNRLRVGKTPLQAYFRYLALNLTKIPFSKGDPGTDVPK
jgi:hypothetical protein